jgi:DNA repair protein RadA/Sms
MVSFGEVGLSGEVRAVSQAAQRVAEAEKLGFEVCVLPQVCVQELGRGRENRNMRLIGVKTVQDAIDLLL